MSAEIGFARHFVACNRHDFDHFVPFFCGPTRCGHVKKETADTLLRETDLFEPHEQGLALPPRFDTFDARSEALLTATQLLAALGNKSLRDEFYPVVCEWSDAPLAQLDRAAVPWFGVRAWGIHANGFVKKDDKIFLWIGERAKDRPVAPGKLDNLFGGGQPIGLSLDDNLCKEAKEEAGVNSPMALGATYIRTLSYLLELPDGLRNDTLFLYDLELPEKFTPTNTDGEVAAFHLKPVDEVAEIIYSTDRFKFNCPLVILDFLMRHGFFSTEHEEFDALKDWLDNKS